MHTLPCPRDSPGSLWHALPTELAYRILPFAWPTFPCQAELRAAHADARAVSRQITSPLSSDTDVYIYDDDEKRPAAGVVFLKNLLRARNVSIDKTVDPDTGEEFLIYWYAEAPA